ncbi:MAG: LysR family transcriptional regulator [Desulfofustis sp.]|nr:LysR family transcriptional regulator [Desulfofustis sp.]
MKNLEIKHFRMICALADCSTMTRAAEKLCITQSALSQQLKDIETKLGIDLFFRTRRQMIITDAGRQLQRTAVEVLEAVELAERAIARKTKGEKGELKIGTQCIFCYKWLPRALHLFHAKFPNIEIHIGNSLDLVEELEGKKYDVVITGAVSPSDTYTAVSLFADQLVCIMPDDHPLTAGRSVRLHDFAGENFISHTDAGRDKFYQQALKPAGIEPKRIMNIGAPQAIVEMVIAGFGISVFPRWAVIEALNTWPLAARPITPKGLPLTWHAVYLTHSYTSIYQQEFIKSISRLKVTEENRVMDHLVRVN